MARNLTIACYRDYRPYAYINDKGAVAGVLVDYWNLWSRKTGNTVTYVPGHLKECLERVRTGQADIMIGLFRSADRAAYLDFSNSMLDIQTNLYVRQDLGAETIQALKDIPVGVIEADYAASFLAKHHPRLRVTAFSGPAAVIKSALAGKLDAYALDFPNAVFLLAEKDAMTRFRLLAPLYTEKLRAGVAKGDSGLLAEINKGMKQITAQDIKQLFNKWGLMPEPLILRYKGWFIAAMVLLLAGCIGFGAYVFRLKSRLRHLKTGRRPFDRNEWLARIKGGENDATEFKSSLRWNLATRKTDKVLEFVVVKTLSAFLNARGGSLFIGVDDQGGILGLDADYKSFQKKPDRDGFMLKLSSLISQHLGRQSHKFIAMDVHAFDGKDVCCITVRPGDRPVFLKEKGQEFFYIRAGAGSVPLSMSEAHAYISSRWSPP